MFDILLFVGHRQIKRERRDHIRNMIQERMVYHRWRKRCADYPEKYLCIILDGMDQHKTCIPNFNTGEDPASVTVRVIGAIAHSRDPDRTFYAYLVTNYTKETNTNIEVLRRILESRDSLPPTLVIQLDNTSQDNKNSHFFSFLASLVESPFIPVHEIIVNFLPVGHTHVSDVAHHRELKCTLICLSCLCRRTSTVSSRVLHGNST